VTTPSAPDSHATTRKTWLPAVGTWKYHLMLAGIGIFVLGPLGGVTASYMNFSLGFFVGGQVLAGILGSSVTYGYGAEGKHGANFMQTAAASVASMSGMAVLIQAMVWLGLPQPPAWQLVLYLMCIGMFGVGVGMLYTPILVDRLQLTFPSGLAVANILRALTDKRLLKQSIAKLGGGALLGVGGGLAATFVPFLGAIELSTSTLGAGMIVGARIGIPAIVGGLLSTALMPYFISIGWLAPGQPFRKITFLIALGMIMGAAIVDLTIIFWKAAKRVQDQRRAPKVVAVEVAGEEWKRTSTTRLVLWVVCWGTGIALVGSFVLHVPLGFLLFAIALVFLFAMVNGISLGISDSNPISSAFVVTVVLMGALGLRDAGVGLMAGSILLVSTSIACDMQQDRSTGWRLGTNRVLQFRYQVAGVTMGAILAVVFAKVFMQAYPDLTLDQTVLTEAQQPKQWGAAMTYKFVGALRSLTQDAGHLRTAIWVGVGIGFVTELLRKIIKSLAGYKKFVESGRAGFATDFVVDAVVLPSPYASSFGGFVALPTSLWFGGGGIFSSALNTLTKKKPAAASPAVAKEAPAENGEDLPEDMSTTSLVGGGLLAGDSLAALALGIYGLLSTVFGGN
jgi:hypothetical protein